MAFVHQAKTLTPLSCHLAGLSIGLKNFKVDGVERITAAFVVTSDPRFEATIVRRAGNTGRDRATGEPPRPVTPIKATPIKATPIKALCNGQRDGSIIE